VIGLSLAYELACRGQSVCVLDRQEFGREASWAGAGIIPPGSWYDKHPAMQSLGRLGYELLPTWSCRLREETGLDNGWRVAGGVHLSVGLADAARLRLFHTLAHWKTLGIRSHDIDASELADIEPHLAGSPIVRDATGTVGHHVPGEAQLHNPRHLEALLAACEKQGVGLIPHAGVRGWSIAGGRIESVLAGENRYSAGHVCLAAGCWSGPLAGQIGLELPVKPVRGQMALLRPATADPPLGKVVHWNGRYLVPREDQVLVGATVEDAGFSKETTTDAIAELIELAARLGLENPSVEQTWAGLRPGTADHLPILGRLPGLENGWIAAGHYRAGLQMSASTAVVMADLLAGNSPPIDIAPFSATRFAKAAVSMAMAGHR
jgi:glycine oxidase